ncbi:hypothetical protein E2C01_075936 [Portunus trituberculatus]|uniref:Uncharacterized protein n=1 Tax=Portunus trituberculatus TaxID=210409 RepID=A0A5B7IHM8_PORTR|nr:hypothetical protein [Portunus trituberculatus]
MNSLTSFTSLNRKPSGQPVTPGSDYPRVITRLQHRDTGVASRLRQVRRREHAAANLKKASSSVHSWGNGEGRRKLSHRGLLRTQYLLASHEPPTVTKGETSHFHATAAPHTKSSLPHAQGLSTLRLFRWGIRIALEMGGERPNFGTNRQLPLHYSFTCEQLERKYVRCIYGCPYC